MEGRAQIGAQNQRLKPGLSPLARFLSSPCEGELSLSKSATQMMNKDDHEMSSTNDQHGCYAYEPSSLESIGVLPRGVLLDESGIYDGLLVGGEASYCSFNNGGFGGENQREVVKVKGVKGASSSSSANNSASLVKGQWTAEEDSMLVKLVKQHGVRKWSQIAKKLVGRIGKQCRERWHNHLRPDIKKDTWSEEEERLLVEAHEKVGNRWAEIAKRIPGRSENSIKNHWNATKRRQNSKKRSKSKPGVDGSKSSQPSILQEYIRSKTLNDQKTATTPSANKSQIHIPFEPVATFDEYALSTMTQMDGCMHAMQNFYDSFSDQSVIDQVCEVQEPCIPDPLDYLGMDDWLLDYDGSHLCSDAYLSYLLEAGPSPSFDAFESDNFKIVGDDQDSSSNCKKDMDLIEMLLSSSSSQSSCSKRSNISDGSFT